MKSQDEDTHQGAASRDSAAVKRRPGRLGRIVRWTTIAVGGPIAAVVLALAIFVVIGIPIDLSWLRERIEVAASEALNRSAAIEGPIKLVPTVWPTVQIEGIRVGNPKGWPVADFVRLKLARAQLSALAILSGDVRIGEIAVDGLEVSLVTNAEGEPNWLLGASEDAPRPAEAEKAPPALRFVELRELSLTDIAATYRNLGSEETYELKLDEITGTAEDEQPVNLVVQGSIQEVPYALRLSAGSLVTFFDGEAAWRLDVAAEAVGTSLTVKGEIAEPLKGKGLALDFDLKGPEMKELEAILGMKLPPVRSFDLSGHIGEAAGAYRVADLKGTFGRTAFTGDLEVDTSGTRPRLQGAIDVPRIDAGALTAAIEAAQESRSEADGQPAADEEKPPPEAAESAEPGEPIDIDEPILALDPLEKFDADFALTIREVVNSPVAISDASLKLSVMDGKLTGPIKATVAEVPFTGDFRLLPQDGKPAAGVSLSAASSDIGGLLGLVASVEGIEGSFETAELAVSARGDTIRSLVKTAELSFSIATAALSYGHEAGQRPVEFTLDNLDVVFPAAEESRITAAGGLLGEPFSLKLSGGTFIENYIDRNWPFDLTATGGGAEFRLKGMVGGPEYGTGAGFEFSVTGAHVGGLSRWIGVSPDAAPPYALTGAVTLGENDLRARIDEGRLGNTGLAGKFGITKEEGTAVTILELAFGVIDLEELAGLFAEKQESAAAEPGKEAFTIDVPILPSGIELVDSNIELSIERLKMDPSDITEVSLSSQIRNGRVEKAPVRAVIANAALEGSVSTDLQGEMPMFDLDLHSTQVDVGDLLARLGVTQGLDVTAGGFDLSLALRGANVRTMLERSEFSVGIRDGLLRLQDPNTKGRLDIGIPKGTIEAPVGKPIALVLDGRIDRTPVKIAIRTDSLASFAKPKKSLSASLNVALLSAEVNLTGTTPLPVQAGNLQFKMDLGGERFSDFDELLGVSLPPYGPYKLRGEFGSRKTGYYVEGLTVDVGDSALTGALDLDTTQSPPRLNIDLVARSVQLDDFKTGDWSATQGGGDTTETAEAATNTDDAVRGLLSPQVMRSLDGTVTVTVEEVLSGQDRLGSGKLVANLSGGRLAVEPLSVNVPGGKVEVGFALEPTETDIGLEARAEIDGLDYGLLARRIDPQSTTGGLISLDVDVTTRGKNLSEVMAGSNGHIDLAVWPKDLNAGLFDLWAVNLFTAVLPALDSEASKVNCLVARFTLEDGIMRPTALLIDSSRIQASGDGTIDFKNKTIEFGASPKSKKPQMFSAQTPIEVKGRFEDFKVGLPTGALAGTVFRIATSPVVVPFKWMFTEKEPADGKVACVKAWGRGPQP